MADSPTTTAPARILMYWSWANVEIFSKGRDEPADHLVESSSPEQAKGVEVKGPDPPRSEAARPAQLRATVGRELVVALPKLRLIDHVRTEIAPQDLQEARIR